MAPSICELLEGRERRRAPDLVDDALHERPVRLARLARGQPLGIGHERLPRAVTVREIVVRADVDHLVGLAEHRLPEAHHVDAVLLEELHGDVGEAALDVRHPARHDVVRAVFVDHRASLAAALPRGRRGATLWWQRPGFGATSQAACGIVQRASVWRPQRPQLTGSTAKPSLGMSRATTSRACWRLTLISIARQAVQSRPSWRASTPRMAGATRCGRSLGRSRDARRPSRHRSWSRSSASVVVRTLAGRMRIGAATLMPPSLEPDGPMQWPAPALRPARACGT